MGFTALLAAGVGAAGSIGGALIGSNAAGKASAAQVTAQQQALAQQMALYNQGLGVQGNYFQTAENTLNPAITAGQGALTQLHNLLTPGMSAETLAQMPGFAFASQYGTKAAQNALAAKGEGASAGPLATAISQYNNGLASGQYQNIVGNLTSLAGLGTNAATNLAGIAGSAGNAALGVSSNVGTATGNTIGNIGNANASGILGSANALAGGFTGVGNAVQNASLYNLLSKNNGGLYGTGNITGNSNAVGAGTDQQYNNWALQNGLTQADL